MAGTHLGLELHLLGTGQGRGHAQSLVRQTYHRHPAVVDMLEH